MTSTRAILSMLAAKLAWADYMVTSGLTAHGDYIIIADGQYQYAVDIVDVEAWLSTVEDVEACDYSADFCSSVSFVTGSELQELVNDFGEALAGAEGSIDLRCHPQ